MPEDRKEPRPFRRTPMLWICLGIFGGILQSLCLNAPLFQGILLGVSFSTFFGLVLLRRSTSPGAGLIWGVSSAFLLWMVQAAAKSLLQNGDPSSPLMLMSIRHEFPQLIANLICLGLPVGVVSGLYGARRNEPEGSPFRLGRALVAGGFAGIASGLIFGYWMLSGNFFPLLAGLGAFHSQSMAITAQFGVALAIGATFGLLFQRDVHGYGSCMGWGVGYTILWWFAGPLFLFPILSGGSFNWSAEHASELWGTLVGHILYGLILGISYATFDRVWVRLFIQSDPLNRKAEGPGLHILRSLQWGIVAGFIGGALSSPVMIATGMFSHAHGALAEGLLLHLFVSTLIGMNFGLLFRDEASSIGVGIGWGCLFGLMWWYAGRMTFLPLLSTGEIDWRPSAALSLLPSVAGHLLYGAVTAFVFLALERRFSRKRRNTSRRRTEPAVNARSSPAPALWMFVLGLGILLPVLLS